MSLSADWLREQQEKRRTERKGEMEKKSKGVGCANPITSDSALRSLFQWKNISSVKVNGSVRGKMKENRRRPFIKKVEGRGCVQAPLSPRENKCIHKPLFVCLRGGTAAAIKGRFSWYRDNISPDAWRGIRGQSDHQEWKGCRPGRLAVGLAG